MKSVSTHVKYMCEHPSVRDFIEALTEVLNANKDLPQLYKSECFKEFGVGTDGVLQLIEMLKSYSTKFTKCAATPHSANPEEIAKIESDENISKKFKTVLKYHINL